MEELLAQLVEEVSIVASGKQRKQPREIPRPEQRHAASARADTRVTGEVQHTPSGGVAAHGHQAMLRLAADRVRS